MDTPFCPHSLQNKYLGNDDACRTFHSKKFVDSNNKKLLKTFGEIFCQETYI